jgi:hypothetical protein
LAHLFIHCSFAQACWASIGLLVGADGPFDTLLDPKDQLGVPFFMEVIITLSWCIRMQRNNLILKDCSHTLIIILVTSRENLP